MSEKKYWVSTDTLSKILDELEAVLQDEHADRQYLLESFISDLRRTIASVEGRTQ